MVHNTKNDQTIWDSRVFNIWLMSKWRTNELIKHGVLHLPIAGSKIFQAHSILNSGFLDPPKTPPQKKVKVLN